MTVFIRLDNVTNENDEKREAENIRKSPWITVKGILSLVFFFLRVSATVKQILNLVQRPLEVLTNGLSFRVKVVISDYFPSRIILHEAAFINSRPKRFHL